MMDWYTTDESIGWKIHQTADLMSVEVVFICKFSFFRFIRTDFGLKVILYHTSLLCTTQMHTLQTEWGLRTSDFRQNTFKTYMHLCCTQQIDIVLWCMVYFFRYLYRYSFWASTVLHYVWNSVNPDVLGSIYTQTPGKYTGSQWLING